MSARVLPAALLAAALLGLGACAAQPAPLAANESVAAERDNCTPTGSRIRSRDGDCTPRGYPFRSYSVEELEATGEIDLVEALREIDPAFR